MTKAKAKPSDGKKQRTQFGIPTTIASPPWQETVGTYLTGQEEVDSLDLVAIEMERKWGAGRLRLLVDIPLREKFDRQRYLVNQALWHGELQDVIAQARRMVSAWKALDRAAEAAGRGTLEPEVWEVTMADGVVAAIVKDPHHASKVAADNRHVRVYTLSDIAHLIKSFPELIKAKQTFPGAYVEMVRTRVSDPLDGVPDSRAPIDDPIGF